MKKICMILVLVLMIGALPSCKKTPTSPDIPDLETQYTLSVSIGVGVDGSPATGSTSYSQGQVISYSYSLASGYMNLVVSLDGQSTSASGSVTMNANHTLSASAEVTTVTFTQADLIGTWVGTMDSLNITFAVDASGSIDWISGDCALIGDMIIDSAGEVTGEGIYTENFSNWGQASWTLQMSNDKATMSGTLGAMVWGTKSVNLTKQ